jgi:DNA adenine methylase
MIDDGIFDGDIVVIRKQETANDGQTVVAIIDDNEATLKKIYREKSRIKLQPANQEMLPIYRKEVEVRGVVVKIVRNLENGTQDNTLAYKKKIFLDRIRSSNPNSQNKYKRVVLSPIRYAGGKSLAVGHIIELLPENTKRVVSPFFGGGSIEIAMSKELGLEVVGYDIFDILCNYWKFQIEKPKLLYKKLKELKPNKKTFEKIRLILNDVWKKKIKLDPLTLAVYYVYNFNLSYGPGFMGWLSDIYLDETRYKRMLERIRDFDPQNLKVECADFQQVIKNHTNDFLYCDPPYYIGDDSKMFKGIYPMRNIPVHHNGFPHEILRDLLKSHKGGFILSYNNCPTIRKYYKEFQQLFPSWQYTMGQGETRIGKNRIENGDNHIKQSHEIIIFCPPKIRAISFLPS